LTAIGLVIEHSDVRWCAVPMFTRREFLALMPPALRSATQRPRTGNSRLQARVRAPAMTVAPGDRPLGLERGRDGLLRIPSSYRPDTPAPLALLLHGAGGRAQRIVTMLGLADRLGVVVLAPDSRDGTWDAIGGDYGPDVAFINRALEHTFDRVAINPRKVAIGGFSDGATYALSLGLDNGDLFTHILAFSPGFVASRNPTGRPRIFVSHGRQDQVLPIAATSRRLVPALDDRAYDVVYREFDGPHTVPPSIAHEAFGWFGSSS
jgi:phospholipase/carboxylesterase